MIEKVPCKHMYRLAYEFNLFQPPSKIISGFTRNEALCLFDELNYTAKEAFIYELDFVKWKFYKNDVGIGNLLSSDLVVANNDIKITLPSLTKNKLQELCKEYNINYKVSYSKSTLVDTIINNLTKDDIETVKKNLPLAVKRNPKSEDYFGSIKMSYNFGNKDTKHNEDINLVDDTMYSVIAKDDIALDSDCEYNNLTYSLLALFLGMFGTHKFYIKEYKSGFKYLLFCWTFIPWIFSIKDGLVHLVKYIKQNK